MVVTIIPTIRRETLKRAIKSVVAEGALPLVASGGTAGENRNKALMRAKNVGASWITYLDDDDYYNPGWLAQLDPEYDIIVLRMYQAGSIIPDETDEVRFCNVGINFALNMERIAWLDIPHFDSNGVGEDWRFLEKILRKYPKVHITNQIYYVAETRGNNQ
jgi:glycosyltransferase involved in cell wall biosynthesis